jgi:hypothetical protein
MKSNKPVFLSGYFFYKYFYTKNKKIIHFIFSFSLFVFSFPASAQDISGNWTGTLKQQAGGTRTEYFFSLDINLNGKTIEGTSYINYLDKPEIYALFKLSGNFEKNQLKFSESEIVSQREEQMMYWCTKYGTLEYTSKDNLEYLSGKWAAKENGCSPGTIFLSRKKNQEINVSENQIIKPEDNPVKKEPEKNENINKRSVSGGTEVKIKGSSVTLKIYDHGIEDGDTVSLYLNDRLLLGKYRLTKTPLKLDVKLDPKISKNKLVFFAENLGKIPPNTAAVIIEAPGFSEKVILRSDFHQSDVIYFEHDK